MVTRAKRQSNNAWDKDNMRLVACKVRKDIADRFKVETATRNTTPNAVLKDAVLQFLGEQSRTQSLVVQICNNDGFTVEQVQASAKAAGQTVDEWICEAIREKL